MKHKQLLLTARMLGWYPFAGGHMMPPLKNTTHNLFLIVEEGQYVIGDEQSYSDVQKVYDYITKENPHE